MKWILPGLEVAWNAAENVTKHRYCTTFKRLYPMFIFACDLFHPFQEDRATVNTVLLLRLSTGLQSSWQREARYGPTDWHQWRGNQFTRRGKGTYWYCVANTGIWIYIADTKSGNTAVDIIFPPYLTGRCNHIILFVEVFQSLCAMLFRQLTMTTAGEASFISGHF